MCRRSCTSPPRMLHGYSFAQMVVTHLILLLLITSCSTLAHCSTILHPVHTSTLAGTLSLYNGTIKTAQALVLHSTRTLSNHTAEFRAVFYLIDPVSQHNPLLHFDNNTKQHGHLLPPHWQQHLPHPPHLRLQPVKYLNRVVHENISIDAVVPRAPSNMMKTLNATTQHYSYLWGMLKAHGPFHYRAQLDMGGVIAAQPGKDWALCVEDWWHCARVPAARLGLQEGGQGLLSSHVMDEDASHWLVLKPFFAASVDDAAARLFAVLTHHIQLGFAGALLYDNGGYEAALRAHPLLTAFLDKLRIVQWTHADLYPVTNSQTNQWPEYFNYMQEMIYTHAALSAWGSNMYLLYSDVDEFLLLPNMAQRLGPNPIPLLPPDLWHVRYMQLQRINYLCDVAHVAESERQAHHNTQQKQLHPANVLQPYMQCSKTLRESWTDWPKVWVHADVMASMVVHEGLVWPEVPSNATMAPVQQSLALLVHVHNLFFDRAHQPEGEELVVDDAWLLPLQRAHERSSVELVFV